MMIGREREISLEYNQMAKSLLSHSFDDRPSIDQLIDKIDGLLWPKLFDQDSKVIDEFINNQIISLLQSLFFFFFLNVYSSY